MPPDMPQRMARFGKFYINPQGSTIDIDYETYYRPFMNAFQSDPAKFVDDLAAVVLPEGGWAAYGGQRYILDVAPDQVNHPANLAMMDVGIAHVLSVGYTRQHLNRYELDRIDGTND